MSYPKVPEVLVYKIDFDYFINLKYPVYVHVQN